MEENRLYYLDCGDHCTYVTDLSFEEAVTTGLMSGHRAKTVSIADKIEGEEDPLVMEKTVLGWCINHLYRPWLSGDEGWIRKVDGTACCPGCQEDGTE